MRNSVLVANYDYLSTLMYLYEQLMSYNIFYPFSKIKVLDICLVVQFHLFVYRTFVISKNANITNRNTLLLTLLPQSKLIN